MNTRRLLTRITQASKLTKLIALAVLSLGVAAACGITDGSDSDSASLNANRLPYSPNVLK